MQQEIGLQSRSESLTFRARVRYPLSRRLTVSSCRGQRYGPSHDLRACITIDLRADPHCDQIDGLAPARAELGTPPDQHAGHNPMCTGGLRNDCAGLLGFKHYRRFCVGEAAALLMCGRRPIGRRRRYQDVFSTSGPLSTIASTSAYRRAGSWRSGCQDISAIGLLSSAANGEPIYCAIAASHGSWERPDNAFADAARTSVANNDAPDFEMRAGTDVNAAELHSARPPALRDTAMASPAAPDHCERTWLSPLFPVKPRPSERSRIDGATTIGL
jgi:hypothetical protein